jgi:nitroimidazol reductase NimA-like FMN-containing flavoprotein (pyridoxamine 5'-phosphate oxidase superfamily)
MRKASREMPAEWAFSEVLDKAPYVTVSMITPEGTPYSVPLSLARTDDHTFYFHCAAVGKKVDCLAANPKVWLSAVSRSTPTVGPRDGSFTLQYRSEMAEGVAERVENREEKIEALRAISQRFLPDYMYAFDAAIERSLDRTAVYRITLTSAPTGKRKQYDAEGNEMRKH